MSKNPTQISSAVHDYMVSVSLREAGVLRELRKETEEHPDCRDMSVMQISPEQGQFMGLLLKLLNASKTLDIGTFTGYSALCMAMAMPKDSLTIACDLSVEWTAIARRYWKKAAMDQKIDLRLAPAMQTLDGLISAGESGTFDFAFIDADKGNYSGYFERCLLLVRSGGLIAIDNVLWSGKVADPNIMDEDTTAIRELNVQLKNDDRIDLSMIGIGDGLTLALKR